MNNYDSLASKLDMDITNYLFERRIKNCFCFGIEWKQILLICYTVVRISSVIGYNFMRRYMVILKKFLAGNKTLSVIHISLMIYCFDRTVLQ